MTKNRRNAVTTHLYQSGASTSTTPSSPTASPSEEVSFDATVEHQKIAAFIEKHKCKIGSEAWILSGLTSGFVSSMAFIAQIGMPYYKATDAREREYFDWADTAVFLRSGNPKVTDEPAGPKSGKNMSKSAGHGFIGTRIPLNPLLTRRNADGTTAGLHKLDEANVKITDPSHPNYQHRVPLTCSVYDLVEQTGPLGDFEEIGPDDYDVESGVLTLRYREGSCGDAFQQQGKILLNLKSDENQPSLVRASGIENPTEETRLITRATVRFNASQLLQTIREDGAHTEEAKVQRESELRRTTVPFVEGGKLQKPEWLSMIPDEVYNDIYGKRILVEAQMGDKVEPIFVLANKPRTAQDLLKILIQEKYLKQVDIEFLRANPLFQSVGIENLEMLKEKFKEMASPEASFQVELASQADEVYQSGLQVCNTLLNKNPEIEDADLRALRETLENFDCDAAIELLHNLEKRLSDEVDINHLREKMELLQIINQEEAANYSLLMKFAQMVKQKNGQSLLEAVLEDPSSPLELSTKVVTGDDDGLATCPPHALLDDVRKHNELKPESERIRIDTVFNTFQRKDESIGQKALNKESKALFKILQERAEIHYEQALSAYESDRLTGKVPNETPTLSHLRRYLTPIEMLILGFTDKGKREPLQFDDLVDEFYLSRAGCIKPFEFLTKMLSNHATRLKTGSPLQDSRWQGELNRAYRAALSSIEPPITNPTKRAEIVKKASEGFVSFYGESIGRKLKADETDEVLIRLREFFEVHLERRLASGENLDAPFPNPQHNALMMATLQHGDDNRNPYGSDIDGKILAQVAGQTLLLESPEQLINFLLETDFVQSREFDLNWGWDMRAYPESGKGWGDVAESIIASKRPLASDIQRAYDVYEHIQEVEGQLERSDLKESERALLLDSLWKSVSTHKSLYEDLGNLEPKTRETVHAQTVRPENLALLRDHLESKKSDDKQIEAFCHLYDENKLDTLSCPRDRMPKEVLSQTKLGRGA